MIFLVIIVTITALLATSSGSPQRIEEADGISLVFPGEQPQAIRDFRSKEAPKCKVKQDWLMDPLCGTDREGGFCEEDEDYDAEIKERFDNLIKQSTFIQEVMENDILVDVSRGRSSINFQNFENRQDSQPSPTLSTRFGPFTSEITVCPAIEKIIYPKRAQTATNDWVFILNQQHMQQGVRVEICHRENNECMLGGSGIPRTQCRQKYIYRKLLTMNHMGSNIVPETVLLPSCCVCYVSSDFATPRMARNSTTECQNRRK